MNHIKYIIAIITIFLLALFSSCGHEHTEGDGHNHGGEENTHSPDDGHNHGTEKNTHSEDDGHNHGGEEHHKEGLHLSKAQAETIGLEFGSLSSIKVNDFVKATGSLGVPPNAYSSVSVKTSGIIKWTEKFVEGEYIEEGGVIAFLENADFIVMQQDYLEAKTQLNFKQLEVERQKILVDSNAGVAKNLQNAQAEVAVLEVKSKGLEKQLSFLGISTFNLTPSTIREQIVILAPVSGYISKINFHNGMYAQPSVSLMDIISIQHLHLELDVFEKDIANVRKGQKISYTVPALGQTIYQGAVEVIGKEFDSNTKTIRVHGHLDRAKPNFLKDLFINAKIYLNNVESSALPEKAIIKDGSNSYIYVADEKAKNKEIEFEKIAVVTYVYAQSKAGELEHEH